MKTLVLHAPIAHHPSVPSTIAPANAPPGEVAGDGAAADGGISLVLLIIGAVLVALALRLLRRAFVLIGEAVHTLATAGLATVLMVVAMILVLLAAVHRG